MTTPTGPLLRTLYLSLALASCTSLTKSDPEVAGEKSGGVNAQPGSTAPGANVNPSTTRETTQAPDEVAEGKKYYLQACASCHGADGTGSAVRQMLPKIGDLTSPELHTRMKDEDIAALVTNGRDKMPPFGGVLKPEQIKKILAYIHTLTKG